MSENITEIQKLQAQVEMLMKMADKSKLSRFMQQTDLGKSVKILLWNHEGEDKVVLSYRLVEDYVNYRGKDPIDRQNMEMILDTKQATRKIENAMKITKDEVKLAERKKEIEELQLKAKVVVPYLSFIDNVKKVPVQTTGMTQKNGETFVLFNYLDQDYEININHIN